MFQIYDEKYNFVNEIFIQNSTKMLVHMYKVPRNLVVIMTFKKSYFEHKLKKN